VKEHGKSVNAAVEAFAIDLPEEDIANITDFIDSYLDSSKEPKTEEPKELFPEEEQNKSFSLDEIYEIIKENKESKEKLAEIELKAGAVLNKKNKADLSDAQKLIQNVLDSAETAEPPEPPKEEQVDLSFIKEKSEKKNKDIDFDELTGIVKQSITEEFAKIKPEYIDYRKVAQEMIDKARGKV